MCVLGRQLAHAHARLRTTTPMDNPNRRPSSPAGSATGSPSRASSRAAAWRMAKTVVLAGALGTAAALLFSHMTAPKGNAKLQPGDMAPAFALEDVRSGDEYEWRAQPGRVQAVVFWATWCGYCVEELPTWSRLATELGPRGLDVVAVSAEPKPKLVSFLSSRRADRNYSFPVLTDDRGRVSRQYGISGYPSWVLVGDRGQVLRVEVGASSEKSIRGKLEDALADPGAES